MKHLALLASVYALIAALVLPGAILAQEDVAPAGTEAAPTAGAEPGEPPVVQQQAGEADPAAGEPAPSAPAESAPAEAAPAEPAPAETQAAPAEPAPQFLADENSERRDAKPKAVAAASGSVTIADFNFAPATITVNQGDTVTWVNNGPTAHTATASDGSFDTGLLQKGQSGSHTFDQAGTFAYICTPHPFMKGTVVVEAAQTGGGDTSGSGGGEAGTTGSTGSGAEAAQADESPTLPNTGTDTGALVLLGALMLLLGYAVHRRATAGEAGPAGRIGW
jgi:LPXTG-motif cell wall-anchored protein